MTVPARRPEDDALDRMDERAAGSGISDEDVATVREAMERLRESQATTEMVEAMLTVVPLRHRAESAEAEVRQLREENASLVASANVAVAQSDRDAAEVRRLTEGLREYGHHKQGCNQLKSPGLGRSPEFSGQECDCGLAALLSASPTDGGGA